MKRSHPTYLFLVLALSAGVSSRLAQAQEQDLFWIGATQVEETRGNTIFRYSLNSDVTDTLVQAMDLSPDATRYFYYLTIDTLRRQIYWTDSGGTNSEGQVEIGAIMRASYDGYDPKVFLGGVVCGVGTPLDIELDPIDEILYWSQGSDCPFVGLNTIDLDKSFPDEMRELHTSGNYSVQAIEIDKTNNMIYWTNNDFFVTEPLGILRAPLNETTSEEYIVFENACDIALALTLSKIYWTPCESNIIRRSNLDGTNAEDVIVSSAEVGKLAIDQSGGIIYWTETGEGNINRARLDGAQVENLLSGLIVPGSVALSFGGLTDTTTEPDEMLPQQATLLNVYPNPIQTSATISFNLAEPTRVTLKIFDLLGRSVETLASENFPSGQHTITWNPTSRPNGIYLCWIDSGRKSKAILMILRR